MVRRWAPLVLLTAALVVGAAALAPRSGDSASPASEQQGDPRNAHPVAGNFEPDDTKLAGCRGNRCWEQAFGNLAFEQGPKAALRVFDDRIARDRAVEGNCHRIAHMIGSAALARYQGNVARAFAEGSSSCWSGYYHGILERALVGVGTKIGLVTVSRRLCADSEVRAKTFTAYQCVHGLGHGLMIRSGLDLPFSLSICDELATDWDQTSCTGGVFMENFNSSYGMKSRFVKDDDLIYPCNTVAERHKLYCYLQITDRLLAQTGYDWSKAARLCATAAEADWRPTCFQSFGRNASGVARKNIRRLRELCSIPARRWRGDCVYGAVRDIVSNDAGAERAGRFCSFVETSLRARCFNGAGTIIGNLVTSPAAWREACAEITSRFLDACLLHADA